MIAVRRVKSKSSTTSAPFSRVFLFDWSKIISTLKRRFPQQKKKERKEKYEASLNGFVELFHRETHGVHPNHDFYRFYNCILVRECSSSTATVPCPYTFREYYQKANRFDWFAVDAQSISLIQLRIYAGKKNFFRYYREGRPVEML